MYAALALPHFAVQAIIRQEPALEGQPVVVVAGSGGASAPVRELSAAAHEAGVARGMQAGQVLARCPGAALRVGSAQAERSAQRVIFARLYAITPHLERTRADLWLLDGRRHAMEELQRRLEHVQAALSEELLDTRVGLAPTPDLAAYAARCATPKGAVLWRDAGAARWGLRTLPVEEAGLDPGAAEILHNWGVHHMGALAKLPRQALGERLGSPALALWDELNGRTARLLEPTRPPQHFEERAELEYRIETLDPLLFLLRRAADSLAGQLAALGLSVRALVLTLQIEDHPPLRRYLQLPEPTTNAALAFDILRGRLEELQAPGPVVGFRLRFSPIATHAHQHSLFTGAIRNPWQLAETLNRLAAVVGPERLGSPRPRDTHRPDAFTWDALPAELTLTDETEPVGAPQAGLPLRRYRPPQPCRVHVRAGKPVALQRQHTSEVIAAARGPWRAGGDWWRREAWAEERWDIEVQGGGLYQLTHDKQGWFLSGEYD